MGVEENVGPMKIKLFVRMQLLAMFSGETAIDQGEVLITTVYADVGFVFINMWHLRPLQ